MDSTTALIWTDPFPLEGMPGWFLLLPCFIENSVCTANSVDPDQTSNLGLHCLPMSLSWNTSLRYKNLLHFALLLHFAF